MPGTNVAKAAAVLSATLIYGQQITTALQDEAETSRVPKGRLCFPLSRLLYLGGVFEPCSSTKMGPAPTRVTGGGGKRLRTLSA